METARKKYIKFSASVLWILVLVALFVVLVCLACWFLFFWFSSESKFSESSKKYQYFQVNPRKNESSYGFVSIFDDLEGDEYMSYEDKDGNFVLVSNFGYKEFQCTGSCFCGGSRRGSSAVASRGLIYLVAAMSSVLAFEKANEYFDNKCEGEMEEKCLHNEKVFSRVDSCEGPIDVEYEMEDEKKKGGNGDDNDNDNDDDEYEGNVKEFKFWCEGNCLTKDNFEGTYAEEARKQYKKTFQCEEVEGSGGVVVQGISKSTHSDQMKLAELEFQNKFLKNLCISAGTEIVMKKLKDEARNPQIDKFQNKVAMDRVRGHPYEDWGPCVSYLAYSDNRSIRCRPEL